MRKIRGQVKALEGMVAESADCADLLTQVISARRALKSFGDQIIASHMRHCIEEARTQAECRRNLRSLISVLERYVA